ncbi:leucine--tRNA ligase [Candidatus Woesearchaeota archaeon]|nr:leucine--tRNA ligase [Candidatus Woesearchaeota archaeon]
MEKEENIDFQEIEKKWQNEWEKNKIFEAKENPKKKKYYIVEMYPYPSASGLHIGHAFNYTIGDIQARFKIMQGFNVLHPMGFDSFGLPAENAAIKAKSHPKIFTEQAISSFINQQKKLGLTYDWTRMVESHNPDYYKWDQWIFLKMFEKGLAYKKTSAVNWCPKCNTVLANEQVNNGKCWRHTDTNVEIKHLDQWFFKITAYADELYEGIETLKNWPERIKIMQKNWIGKSYGTEILFEINNEKWPVFTTRPDTLFGVTFMVISAQHPKLNEIVTKEQKKEVETFLKKLRSTSEKDLKDLEKEGVFTGNYAINPINNEKIPIYAGNFVIADYGSGIVMAVPSHDQRDFDFAKKYNIKIKQVILSPREKDNENILIKAYSEEGVLINSKEFNGLDNETAKKEITTYLKKKGLAKEVINFRLRDWLISRQRFWGTPIPIVYCDKCGIVPIPEKDLPVTLPEDINFNNEKNPLIDYKPFIETTCPKCRGKARRETDTMDTFVNSSWYFLRYCDNKNKERIFNKDKVEYWNPIDLYIGGAEHACMHLIYFRFYTKFLRDLGLLDLDEPTYNLFNQGMVHGEDGSVMSKSKGNVIDPLDVSKKYSADTLRIFLVSMASPDKDSAWSSTGIESMHKFIKKFFVYSQNATLGVSSLRVQSKINKLIKETTQDLEKLQYNLAIIKLRKFFDIILEEKEIAKKDLENYIKLLSPFCPHIAEELWHKLGNKTFISLESWPVADESKINEKLEEQEKTFDKTVGDIISVLNILKEKNNQEAKKVYVYVMPNELEIYNEEILTKRIGKPTKVYAVNDKDKYDPQGKSSKAKPAKPGIFVE